MMQRAKVCRVFLTRDLSIPISLDLVNGLVYGNIYGEITGINSFYFQIQGFLFDFAWNQCGDLVGESLTSAPPALQ